MVDLTDFDHELAAAKTGVARAETALAEARRRLESAEQLMTFHRLAQVAKVSDRTNCPEH